MPIDCPAQKVHKYIRGAGLICQDNHLVTFDGTTPTATNGHTMYPGQPVHWNPDTAIAAKFLALTGAGAIMGSQFQILPGATQLPDTAITKEIPI